MERKHYGFFSDGSNKLNGTLQYEGWFTEEGMKTFAQGLVVGMKIYCKSARILIYEIEPKEVKGTEFPFTNKGLIFICE